MSHMTQADPDELLSAQQVASLYDVTASTVSRWAREGKLPPAIRTLGGVRKFRRADVEAVRQAALTAPPAA